MDIWNKKTRKWEKTEDQKTLEMGIRDAKEDKVRIEHCSNSHNRKHETIQKTFK